MPSPPAPAPQPAAGDPMRVVVPSTTPRITRHYVASYEQGRTCSVKGCTTKLSRYNKGTRCWTHDNPSGDGTGILRRPS